MTQTTRALAAGLALALLAAVAAARPPAKADHKTTAEELSKEFIADAAAAEKKYKGKVVEVEGVVEAANKGSGGAIVTLRGAKKKEKDLFSVDVACGVTGKAAAAALKLKGGERVVYRGTLLFGTASRVNLGDGEVRPAAEKKGER